MHEPAVETRRDENGLDSGAGRCADSDACPTQPGLSGEATEPPRRVAIYIRGEPAGPLEHLVVLADKGQVATRHATDQAG